MFLTSSRVAQAALEALPPAAALIVDETGRIVEAEGDGVARHGLRTEDIIGVRFRSLLPFEARPRFVRHFEAALEGEVQSFDHWAEDRQYGYWIRVAPIEDGGSERRVVAVLHDITERLLAMTELERSQTRLHEAERLGNVGSWELRPSDGTIVRSPGLTRLFRLAPEEDFDLATFYSMVVPEDRATVGEAIERCRAEGQGGCEYRIRRRDGSLRTILAQGELIESSDSPDGLLIGTAHDVTGEREVERERAVALALFEQGFDAAPIGMVLNDPETGAYLRVNDAVCELFGRSRDEILGHSFEEFAHPDALRDLRDARARMVAGRAASYEAEYRYLRADGTEIWTSVHITPVRRPDGSIEVFFTQIVDITERKEHEERLRRDVADARWLSQIRRALDEDGLLLYSQPIVDLSTGETVQNELLLRMVGEEGRIHAPGEFLPVAERYGLISEIDRWVVREAVRLAAAGNPVEFNLSARSLDDPFILRFLERQIERTGADPSLLVVEVTETSVVNRLEVAGRFAERIRELGCTLALDDFGTGFANLSYLKHIPSQHLKIDIEFIRELAHSETDKRLVLGIVAFAKAFGQKTVAEGVEDEKTLIRLRQMGVDMAQGYLLGRPRPLDDEAGSSVAVPARRPCEDAVARVEAAFAAFARRDVKALETLCTEDVVVQPFRTLELTGRTEPYRGPAGLRRYFGDLETLWHTLELRPKTFVESEDSVLVFAEAQGETDAGHIVGDALCVCRLRGEKIASVDVFRGPPREG